WLLSHHAGLPAVDVDLTLEEVCAWEPLVLALEAQKPYWTPGEQYMYHALTYGFLVGEVVRRVTGRPIGRFFGHQIAGPVGRDTWIGLPAELEPRVAHLVAEPPRPDVAALYEQVGIDPATAQAMAERRQLLLDPDSLVGRSITLGDAYPDGLVTE